MEMDTQYYDDIIIGGGKAGKTLAPALVADGRKTALVERSLNMIGGSCPNIACIPSKTMVASAEGGKYCASQCCLWHQDDTANG
jgi:pyruvate/2-oxoglutarate dehydrogenase complex dihydrolipoamide dehydrogenase (E3) component